jgi:hypothetical protein
VVDRDGIVIREGKAASEPEAITAWLTELGITVTRVGLEIGGLARWLYAVLRAAGWPAICIDPRRLRGLTLARWPPSFDHVLGDARLRDLKPELKQFAVNTWRNPKRILHAQLPNQRAQLRVDPRSPSQWA